jgi:neutral ceramidase
VAAAALLVALVCPVSSPAAPGAKVRVGVGRADITPPTEIYEGGWASSIARARGQHTRLFARVIVLERGGTKIALVAEDLSFLSAGMVKEAARMLRGRGFSERNVLDSASHTHGAPGGYMNFPGNNTVLPAEHNPTEFELGDTPADPTLYSFLTRQLAKAIRRADDDLGPGAVGWGETRILGLTRNRSLEAHLANHGIHEDYGEGQVGQDPQGYAHTIDPEVHVLRVDKLIGGRPVPVGIWSTFAAHGTVVKPTFPYWNADHHASAERVVEAALRRLGHVPAQQDVVNVYGNTDEGDISAGLDRSGPAAADYVGRVEARAMLRAWRRAGRRMSRSPDLDLRWTRTCFCGQQTAEGAIDTKAVVGLAGAGGSEELRSIFSTATIFEGMPAPVSQGVQGRKVQVVREGTSSLPNAVPLLAIRIADRVIVSVPGEATAQMGRRIRASVLAAVASAGIERVIVSGLANDYLSYFATPEEYDVQHYEGGFTLFGRAASVALEESLVRLASRLAAGRPAPPPHPFNSSNGVHVTRARFPRGAARGIVFSQPHPVERLGRARFGWRGGPRGFDRPVDAPFVIVQRRVGGWRAVTDDLGMEIVWSVDDEGRYEALWEVPLTARAGTYRFVVTANRYGLTSRPFRVRPSDELVLAPTSGRGRAPRAVRLQYPRAVPDLDITFRPAAASGGRIAFRVNGRERVVERRRGTRFAVPGPRAARVVVRAGAARDRYGNRNGKRLVLR